MADSSSSRRRRKPARYGASDLRRLDRITAWLFLVGYLLTLVDPAKTSSAQAAVVFLSSASLALGTLGFAWTQYRGFWARLAYLTVQMTLSTFLMMLTGPGIGNTIMVLLVLAQSTRILPLWLVLVFCSHLLVAHLGMDNWQDVAREGVGLFVAGVGVVLITRVAVNERIIRSEKEALAEQLEIANRQLRRYAQQAEELAATRERNRLAREIHDGLGHHLTATYMQLQAAQAVLLRYPNKAEEALEKARTLTQEALSEVRRSVQALRVTSRPLSEALTTLVRGADLPVELVVIGTLRQLPEELENNLYRIVQEGLTNICKHAGATRATVTLLYDEYAVELSVVDDGHGSSSLAGGFGLTGIRERVEEVGGTLTVDTAPDEGLALHVKVPT